MSSLAYLHTPPKGFPQLPTYKAEWRAIRFELMPGTGEWITSHIALRDEQGSTVKQVLRQDFLRALFGSQAKHFQSMLDYVAKSFEKYLEDGGELSEWKEPLEGFAATPVRNAFARQGRLQALRIAARQTTALCAIDELDLHSEPPSAEDESRFWSNRIKDAVVLQKPDLAEFFDRDGMLYSQSVRFGFLTSRAAAHFANITPASMSYSMRMARGKLQELRTGKKTMELEAAMLISGAPSLEDINFSEKQISAALAAIAELNEEAIEAKVMLRKVSTVPQAVTAVIEMASV